jgi:hypothetical protein
MGEIAQKQPYSKGKEKNMNDDKHIRMARREFIPRVPNTCTNTKDDAVSTLLCEDDIWGLDDTHYRWVNKRDDAGQLIPRKDEDGQAILNGNGDQKFEKELILIGQPHFNWEGPFVQVRVGLDHSTWYIHWPVAAEMFLSSKLDASLKNWLIEEGAQRFQDGLISHKNVKGEPTQAIKCLLKLKVIRDVGNEYRLASDVEEALEAASKDLIEDAAKAVELIPEDELEEHAKATSK